MDESPFKILKTNKNGYIWVLRSNNGIYYQYELTKSGKVAQEIIGNYKGIVVTDGFGAYRRILKPPNVLLAGCWAHVRRRFYDSIDTSGEATEIVSIIDQLFDIEHKAKSFDELIILRQQESLKLVEKLERIFLEVKDYYVKAFPIRKAMAYFYKNREELLLFLTKPEVPLSNNGSERAIKGPVLGRKNYNGFRTVNGADTAMVLLGVIETCKLHQLNPRVFLKEMALNSLKGLPLSTPLEYAKSIRV